MNIVAALLFLVAAPGRYDKPIWAAILLIGNILGATVYFAAKRKIMKEPAPDLMSRIPQYPGPCIKCGTTIPADATECPSCGWSFAEGGQRVDAD